MWPRPSAANIPKPNIGPTPICLTFPITLAIGCSSLALAVVQLQARTNVYVHGCLVRYGCHGEAGFDRVDAALSSLTAEAALCSHRANCRRVWPGKHTGLAASDLESLLPKRTRAPSHALPCTPPMLLKTLPLSLPHAYLPPSHIIHRRLHAEITNWICLIPSCQCPIPRFLPIAAGSSFLCFDITSFLSCCLPQIHKLTTFSLSLPTSICSNRFASSVSSRVRWTRRTLCL